MNSYLLAGLMYSLLIYYSNYFISILVHQYYSVERLLKLELRFVKQWKNIAIFILKIVNLFIYVFFKRGIHLILVCDFIEIFNHRRMNFKYTRRNLVLVISSYIIGLILIGNLQFFSTFLILVLSFIELFSLVIVICAYYYNFIFEVVIRKYYIIKAKRKINRDDLIVIGITGSFGKTSQKNIIYQILKEKYRICTRLDNTNTLMGICKMINEDLTNLDEILLIEIGLDKKNGMNKYKKLLKLDYAIVTAVGNMHIATFKNINNILKEKMKIVSLLKATGKLFINADNRYLVKENGIKYSEQDLIFNESLPISFFYKNYVINTKAYSPFLKSYLSCAIKIAEELKCNDIEIIKGGSCIEDIQRRLHIEKRNGKVIIDDSYNNNYEGIKETIKIFNCYLGVHVIILSSLIELGNLHNQILEKVNNLFDSSYFMIFISCQDNTLFKMCKCKKAIVLNLKEAFDKANEIGYDCLLILSKGDNIYLH